VGEVGGECEGGPRRDGDNLARVLGEQTTKIKRMKTNKKMRTKRRLVKG
jgi:hypothetical protein